MIYEYRVYRMAPGGVERFLDLFEHVAVPIRAQHQGRLLGFWSRNDGEPRALHHLWSYPSLDARQADRAALSKRPEWTEGFVARVMPLIVQQRIAYMQLRHGDLAQLSGARHTLAWLQCKPFQSARVADGLHASIARAAMFAVDAPDPHAVAVLLAHEHDASSRDALSAMLRDDGLFSQAVEGADIAELEAHAFSPLGRRSEASACPA